MGQAKEFLARLSSTLRTKKSAPISSVNQPLSAPSAPSAALEQSTLPPRQNAKEAQGNTFIESATVGDSSPSFRIAEDTDATPGSRSRSELTAALAEFRENYQDFAVVNSQFLLIDEEFQSTFEEAQKHGDIAGASRVFGLGVWGALGTIEKKKIGGQGKWTTKLGNFINKLYPVARLSLEILQAVGDAAPLGPLKGIAAGLGILLQIMDSESARDEEFLYYLGRIEFQAAIIADNPSNLNSGSMRNLAAEKSLALLTASVKFLNKALIHFSRNFPGNLAHSVIEGSKAYDDARNQIDNAIRDYDQAILHLAARALADLKADNDSTVQENQHKKFSDWLSSSYWLVEAQLHHFRSQRGENTLQWAFDMKEFQDWRLADPSSEDRVLWIRGSLGIGKSTMAAYFIDLLKLHYSSQKSIVTYFFCRSNQGGLTSACNIVLTMAHQASQSDPIVRNKLEELRKSGFRPAERLGAGYLVQKLLLEPLRASEKEIFIILDGLDEADLLLSDDPDRSAKPQMNILLSRLMELKSTRLLIISRPDAKVAAIIPTIIKRIGISDNRDDIDSHVTNVITSSHKLKELFKKEELDPIAYFRERDNGIFLWVVLVLQQLEKSKTQSAFHKRIQNFSTASGSMEKLYKGILEKIIDEEDEQWIREILNWLVVAQRPLSVAELQSAVEFSLGGDSLVDFRGFLEEECGSMLHILSPNDRVQVVHETFRDFLLNSTICPTQYSIQKAILDGRAAICCMRSIMSENHEFIDYSLEQWLQHLSKATTPVNSIEVFQCLVDFLRSKALETWINESITGTIEMWGLNPIETSIEVDHLQTIVDWIRKYSRHRDNETNVDNALDVYISDPGDTVGQDFGKAAAHLWATKDDHHNTHKWFLLALKYYLRHANCTGNVAGDLLLLISSELRLMSEWAGGISVHRESLGVAFYVLGKWDKCIQYLDLENEPTGPPTSSLHLGNAFLATGKFESALATFRRSNLDWRPGAVDALEGLIDNGRQVEGQFDLDELHLAYVALFSRQYECTIEIFRSQMSMFETDKKPASFGLYLALVESERSDVEGTYHHFPGSFNFNREISYANGDYDRTIECASSNLDPWDDDRCYESYLCKKDFKTAIRTFEKNGRFHSLESISVLLECYKAAGKIENAILEFRRRVDNSLQSGVSLWGLMEAHKANGDHHSAIAAFHDSIDDIEDPDLEVRDVLQYSVLEAYTFEGPTEAISFIKQQVDSEGYYGPLFTFGMLQVCVETEEYDQAIVIFDNMIQSKPLCPWLWDRHGQSLKAKGDYSAAIQIYKTALQYISVDCTYHKRLGDLYLMTGQMSDAIKSYRTFLSGARKPSAMWAYSIMLPMRLWLYPSKIQTFLRDSLTNGVIWRPLAEALLAVSDKEAAISVYDAAISGYLSALEKRFNRRLLWQYHQPASNLGVFNVFEKQMLLSKSVVWFSLGQAYECKGELSHARRAYEKALESESKSLSLPPLIDGPKASSYPEWEGVALGDIWKEFSLSRIRQYRSLDLKNIYFQMVY